MLLFCSCNENYSPKPRGYFRIDFPEKKYIHYSSAECPFSFSIPEYAYVEKDSNRGAEHCWMYVVFPKLNGQLYLTYKELKNDLFTYTEDSRNLVYRHTVKADAIDENRIVIADKNIYGMQYEIGGNAASNIQFYLTDSVHHFLRGSLYFYALPQSDSLAPVIAFVKKDIDEMIKTFRWK